MRLWLATIACVVAGCAACSSVDPRTEVLVTVDGEPGVRAAATKLRIEVYTGAGRDERVPMTLREMRDFPVSPATGWPRRVGVVPLDGDTTRIYRIVGIASNDTTAQIAVVRAISGFVPGKTLSLYLLLEDACIGRTCEDEGQTCHRGDCIDAWIPPETLPEYNMDGGTQREDGGMQDGRADGGDAGTGCMSDDECRDVDACNGLERCVDGQCLPGEPMPCDDGIGCTEDGCAADACTHVPQHGECTAEAGGTCDPVNGCQYPTCTPTNCVPEGCRDARCEGTTCIRTDRCSGTEICCNGTCVAAGCDDGNECTDDHCDDVTGCVHGPRAGPCDDHDACTVSTSCTGVSCGGGTPRNCEDGNVCTTNACDRMAGCTSTDNALPCSDSDPCTIGDLCMGGGCVAGGAMDCADTILCTRDACAGGSCTHTADSSLCLPGGTCDPVLDCQYPMCTPMNCSSDACYSRSCSGDTCMSTLLCGGGTPLCCAGSCVNPGCDDGEVCTSDSCGPGGCGHAPLGGSCSDSDTCTVGDFCSGGACRPGGPRSCDDSNECTDDSCDSASGCRFTPNGGPCDDFNACTSMDRCSGTSCAGGPPLTCDDRVLCTVDGCDPIGGCTHVPNSSLCGTPPVCYAYNCDVILDCQLRYICAGDAGVADAGVGDAGSRGDGGGCGHLPCPPDTFCCSSNGRCCDPWDPSCCPAWSCTTGTVCPGGWTCCTNGPMCTCAPECFFPCTGPPPVE